ncbi:O-antigen polymerase [Edwardsiella tarda]|uniref:O-antigen polymerase n=1 Tax=Edwardsiella tarda TaxID=636 RepID=UPI0039BEBB24
MGIKSIDYFGVNFFSFIGFSFFIFLPFSINERDGSILGLIIAVIGMFSFYIGGRTKKRFSINNVYFPRLFDFFAKIILVYYFYMTIHFFLEKIEVVSYTESYLNVDYLAIYLKVFDVFAGFLSFYILSNYVGNNKKKFIFVAILSITVNLHSNTRLNLILPAIFWMGYGYYFGFIKLTFLRIFSLLLLSPIVFTFLLLKRVMMGQYDSYIDQIKTIYNYLDFHTLMQNVVVSMETFRSYDIYVRIINEGFIHIESGFIRLFFMIIPRNIWTEKPESVSRIISHNYFPEQYYGGGGTVANIFGDAYINGGVLAVIIILFFWGGISKIIYNTTIKRLYLYESDSKTRAFIITFYLLYLMESIQYFRGFMSESFWRLLYLIAITLILSKIFRRKNV